MGLWCIHASHFLSLDGETRGDLRRPAAALQTHDGAGAVQHEALAACVGDVVVDGVVELDGAHCARDDGAGVRAGEQTWGGREREGVSELVKEGSLMW